MKKGYLKPTFPVKNRIFRRVSIVLLSGFAIWGTLLLSGCTSASQPAQGQKMTTVTIYPSWSRLYQDLKSLKHDSDVAVSGTIMGISKTIPSPSLVMTDFTFQIQKILWDPHKRINSTSIIVQQEGGVTNNTRYVAEDDPLFQVGEEAVLFLHEFSPGNYYVVGGPTGRFLIRGEVVKPINNEGLSLPSNLSESTFYTEIQNS
ncbi:MAG TPA: hypothetical protein VFA09_11995 [Ktedonobacteraceae bacterium]|nr:hypothetical protein [Ktedonobacteraceae bacterium]